MGMQTFLYNLSHSIWLDLGPCETEAMYVRALMIGLQASGLVKRLHHQFPIYIRYCGRKIGTRYIDLIVEFHSGEVILLEIKALFSHDFEKHAAQLHFYMQNSGIRKGVILNFLKRTHFPRPSLVTTPTRFNCRYEEPIGLYGVHLTMKECQPDMPLIFASISWRNRQHVKAYRGCECDKNQ